MMFFKYKGKEYSVVGKYNIKDAGKLIYERRTIGALLDKLEKDKQIEKQIITVYNMKFGDGHYTDDEIDLLLDDLVENKIISYT